MVSLALQDAYLQVPIHHDSRRYLRFVANRYISPLVAPHADSSFFRKRPSFSFCWGAKRDRGGFLPPHHPGNALGQMVQSLL